MVNFFIIPFAILFGLATCRESSLEFGYELMNEFILFDFVNFRSSVNAEYHELPDNFTIAGWEDLADDLLCAGRSALDIINALANYGPNYKWFVLVQSSSLTYSYHIGYTSNYGFHQATNRCGKNLFVWMYSGSSQACDANGAANAQNLINTASSSGSTPNAVVNYILNHEASYSLRHYFTISWSTGSSGAQYVPGLESCVAYTTKGTWYLIRA